MKKILILIFVSFFMLLCGCSASPPQSPREELVLYRWVKLSSDGTEQLSLYFDDSLHLKCKTTQTEFHEDYQLSNNHIIIINPSYGSAELQYEISGSTLTLIYDSASITLTKQSLVGQSSIDT